MSFLWRSSQLQQENAITTRSVHNTQMKANEKAVKFDRCWRPDDKKMGQLLRLHRSDRSLIYYSQRRWICTVLSMIRKMRNWWQHHFINKATVSRCRGDRVGWLWMCCAHWNTHGLGEWTVSLNFEGSDFEATWPCHSILGIKAQLRFEFCKPKGRHPVLSLSCCVSHSPDAIWLMDIVIRIPENIETEYQILRVPHSTWCQYVTLASLALRMSLTIW